MTWPIKDESLAHRCVFANGISPGVSGAHARSLLTGKEIPNWRSVSDFRIVKTPHAVQRPMPRVVSFAFESRRAAEGLDIPKS
jgi:hypothetical protein